VCVCVGVCVSVCIGVCVGVCMGCVSVDGWVGVREEERVGERGREGKKKQEREQARRLQSRLLKIIGLFRKRAL